jgi:hypothetical protein
MMNGFDDDALGSRGINVLRPMGHYKEQPRTPLKWTHTFKVGDQLEPPPPTDFPMMSNNLYGRYTNKKGATVALHNIVVCLGFCDK